MSQQAPIPGLGRLRPQRAARRCGRARWLMGGLTGWLTGWLMGGVLVIGVAQAAQDADSGSAGMFGLFKSKKSAMATSVVHAEVGTALVAAAAFPAGSAQAAAAAASRCDKVAIAGKPPAAQIVAAAVPGQTSSGYRASGLAGQPPLVFANRPGKRPSFELWELGSKDANFQQQRPVQLDPAQPQWAGYLLLGLDCLAAGKLLAAVHYNEPEPRDALYLYDPAPNSFQRIGAVEPDTSAGLPYRYYETLAAGPAATLLRYGLMAQRLAAEVYVNQLNHGLLVSARHPQGLELLRLAIDDGNIRRWALQGRTLWLATSDERDARKPVHKVWTLDLSKGAALTRWRPHARE